MRTNTPLGTCKLCLQTRMLQDSHLLPAALYRMSRLDGAANPNPYLISAKRTIQTSRQIKDYVLCRDCEQRINRGGEHYAMSQVNRNGSFPLLAMLNSVPASRSSSGFSWYYANSTPSIDRDKLGYFALSVFWRASVHIWHRPEKKEPPIRLGALEEPIRRYLLGLRSFPDDVVVLLLFVCTDLFSQNVFYEPSKGNELDDTTWTFQVRGLNFFLSAKAGKPSGLADACMVTGQKRMITTRSCQEKVLGAALELVLKQATVHPRRLT